MAIIYYLYRRFPKANEGFMTEKIALVKNEFYKNGIKKWYIMSANAEEKKQELIKICLFDHS